MAWNDGLYDVGQWFSNLGSRPAVGLGDRGARRLREGQQQKTGEVFDPFFAGVIGGPRPIEEAIARNPAPVAPPPGPGQRPVVPGIEQAINSPNWTPPEIQSPYGDIGEGAFLPAIERSLREREAVAEQAPQSRVNVTIDGKTYDYANGAAGNAPTLAGDAGPGAGQGFGRTWTSPRGGAASFMDGDQDRPWMNPNRIREEADRAAYEGSRQKADDPSGIEAAIYRKEREAEAEWKARGNAEKELIDARTKSELGKQSSIAGGYAKDVAAIDAEEAQKVQELAAYNLSPEDRRKREDIIREIAENRRQRLKESYGFGGRLSNSAIYGG